MKDAHEQPQPPSGLGRYLRIYNALWKNSVTRELSFKANFLMWIVVESLWFALQLVLSRCCICTLTKSGP